MDANLQTTRIFALGAIVLCLAGAQVIAAEQTVVMTDFSDATVGADMSKLEEPVFSGWTGFGSSTKVQGVALIVDPGGDGQPDPALQLGKGAGVFQAIDLSAAKGNNSVIIRFKLTDTASDDWFGLFLRDSENPKPYRLQTNPAANGGKGALILRKDRTQLFSKTISLSGTYEIELRITYGASKNTFAILVDGQLVGEGEDSGQDGSPALKPAANSQLSFSNFNNEDNAKTVLDDISVKIRTASDGKKH